MSRSYDLPSRQLASQADSATIEPANVPRSTFMNTWMRITAFDAAAITPILLDEILPGDHMTYDLTAYIRMATPINPIFSNMRVDTFFFFVPNRLVWDNWVKLMGEQKSPSDSPQAYSVPQVQLQAGGELPNTLYSHFGIPAAGQILGGATLSVNALPCRAYNLIWNEWFRDQNQQTTLRPVNNASNGPDARTDYVMQNRGKAHDYFTTALPWPQKFTAPIVPLGSTAPIIGIGKLNQNYSSGAGINVWETGAGATRNYPFYSIIDPTPANAEFFVEGTASTNGTPKIFADLTAASAITINTLRTSWLVQQLLEKMARGGTRYVEQILEQFGVRNPDYRLQRPEYIGGGQSPLNITPIAQTATGGSGIGTLGAAGTATGRHHASYAATEHGFILGLIQVRSELAYQQGRHKLWDRHGIYNYYTPSLAQIGEQAILNKEIFCDGGTNDDLVFGYQEPWQEYRTKWSEVTGLMNSTAAGTLDSWHLAQRFASVPVLGPTFIIDNPPMARVLAAGSQGGQQFLGDLMFHRKAVRALPTYGTPATLGRF